MGIPYVYIIKNKTTGLKYVGVKYAKNADPEKFWVTYFTSSKHVKKLINMFGKEDFVFRIIKTFEKEYDALKYENDLNKIAFHREDYVNFHYNFLGDKSEDVWLEEKEKQRKIAQFLGKLNKLLKKGFCGLSENRRKEIASMGGKAAAEINRELGRAIFDPEVRNRQHATLRKEQKSAFYDPVLRKEITRKGGKSGIFTKTWYEKKGLTEEDRIEAQRQRGKKGGSRNKGFKWYNDGKKSYKYTAKQQREMSFEQFIKTSGFLPGKIPNNVDKIWVNDGEKNYMISKCDYDKTKHQLRRLGDRSKFNGHKNKKNNKD